MKIPIETVLFAVLELMGLKKDGSIKFFKRRMKAMIGISATTITEAWKQYLCSDFLQEQSKINHMLWTLSFYKSYNTLNVYCCRYKVAKVTFWKLVKEIKWSIIIYLLRYETTNDTTTCTT